LTNSIILASNRTAPDLQKRKQNLSRKRTNTVGRKMKLANVVSFGLESNLQISGTVGHYFKKVIIHLNGAA